MKLSEATPEFILKVIEERSDALLAADELAAKLDADLKAWEALTALAHRDSGMSMAEAEKRVRAHEDWAEKYLSLQEAHAAAARAKRDYQRATIATDLWRSERATARVVN